MNQSASAILLTDAGDLLLQLRDDKQGLRYPAHWGIFGGKKEDTETPEECIKRELQEELSFKLTDLALFREYDWSKDYNTVYDEIVSHMPNAPHYTGFKFEEVKHLFENKRDYLYVHRISYNGKLALNEGMAMKLFKPYETKALLMIPTDKIMLLHYVALNEK